MFYNNGVVFESTFAQEINIPKVGENLAEAIKHWEQLFSLCRFPATGFQKVIYETDEIVVIVIKIGEESNLALFFEGGKDISFKRGLIKEYLDQLENWMDMNAADLKPK